MSESIEHYNDNILAFIDILGFSQLVEKAKLKSDELINILSILKRAKEYKLEADRKDDFKRDLEFSVFSDSIVITCVPTKIHTLLWTCGYIQAEFLAMGVATRGGISFGKAYHKDGILFGQSVLESHYLESQVSKYPRIVVTNEAVEKLLPLVRDKLIITDYDGLDYLNFFDYVGEPGNDGSTNSISIESKINSLNKIGEKIAINLKNAEKLNHKNKWYWLKNKYNEYSEGSKYCDELLKI